MVLSYIHGEGRQEDLPTMSHAVLTSSHNQFLETDLHHPYHGICCVFVRGLCPSSSIGYEPDCRYGNVDAEFLVWFCRIRRSRIRGA